MASLPGVLQSAAIGIPDEKTGELIKVFIVVKPGMTLTKDQGHGAHACQSDCL